MTGDKSLAPYRRQRSARVQAMYAAGHEYKRELDWHCSRCGRQRVRGELRPPRCLGPLGRLLELCADALFGTGREP